MTLKNLLGRHAEDHDGSVDPALARQVEGAIEEERKKLPVIAVIGKRGVGKTTTVMELFGLSGLPVGHVLSRQTAAHELEVTTPHGKVIVYDMPGLGEDITKHEEYLALYKEHLPKADVALWVLDVNAVLEPDQRYLREIRTAGVSARFVFCVNKVDLLNKGGWLPDVNVPDLQRKAAIDEFVAWAAERLGVDPADVVGYSARRFYNLDSLLTAMLKAVPNSKRLALVARANPTSHTNFTGLKD